MCSARSPWRRSCLGFLRLSAGNLCLDDKNNAKANGTAVIVTRCDNSSAQRWTVVKDGSLRIHGMCLDTSKHSLTTGAMAVLWTPKPVHANWPILAS